MSDIRSSLESLIADFAWRIDHNDGRGVEELFTPDGEYGFGGVGTVTGRAEIAGFYNQRRAGGPRLSRHIFSNLHLDSIEDNRASGTCVLTLHAADGVAPLPLSPVMIADYQDEYLLDETGSWRFARRSVSIVFGSIPNLGTGQK